MLPEPVVISGTAVICPLGMDLDDIAQRVLIPEAVIGPPPPASSSPMARPVSRVENFDARRYLEDKKTVRFMSRETQFAVCALQFCMADAGVRPDQTHAAGDIAYFAGTGASGLDLGQIEKLLDHTADPDTGRFDVQRFGREALERLNPLTSFKILPNMPPAVAAIYAGIKGSNLIFNPWEGNALLAFQEAVWAVQSGREHLVFCSGSDCKTHSNARLTFAEFGLLDNSDMILSEGGACIALEPLREARERGAPLYCAIGGVTHRSRASGNGPGYACDPDLYADMMTATLESDHLRPADIDLILGAGDQHGANDAAELQAIDRVMGGACPVLFPKKRLGNAMAAAGMIQLALAAHLLKKGRRADGKSVGRILVNSFGPGSELFCILLESVCNAS